MDNNDKDKDNAGNNNQRRQRRLIRPVVPTQSFDFSQMMLQLALVERAARDQQLRMQRMAEETAERRNELAYMTKMIPQMVRTLDQLRSSHDSDLVEQAADFQQVIDDLSNRLAMMGHQTGYTMGAARDLAAAFDRATHEYDLLNGQLRAAAADTNLFDYRQRRDAEMENMAGPPPPQEDTAQNMRPATAPAGTTERPMRSRTISPDSRNVRPRINVPADVVIAIDRWLAGIERRDVLQNLLEGLDQATLRNIADHYDLRLTRSEARSQASLRWSIPMRLLERRQEGARRRRGRR